jgi:hypothetical protein
MVSPRFGAISVVKVGEPLRGGDSEDRYNVTLAAAEDIFDPLVTDKPKNGLAQITLNDVPGYDVSLFQAPGEFYAVVHGDGSEAAITVYNLDKDDPTLQAHLREEVMTAFASRHLAYSSHNDQAVTPTSIESLVDKQLETLGSRHRVSTLA